MLKQFKMVMLAVFAIAALAACGEADTDVRENARQAVQSTTAAAADAVTPTTAPAVPGQPAAAPTGPTTTIAFAEETFDFGTVDQGEKVSHTYKFTNSGSEPLILSNAKGSCGCTVPVWPREPIAPGATGEITVEFDSKNKSGKRNQKVTITANTEPAQTVISLTGDVNVPGGESK